MDGQGLDEIDTGWEGGSDDEQYRTGLEDKDEDDGTLQYNFLERKGEQSLYKSMQKTLKSDKDGDAHSSFPTPDDLLLDPKQRSA